jgi:hypothetical protein
VGLSRTKGTTDIAQILRANAKRLAAAILPTPVYKEIASRREMRRDRKVPDRHYMWQHILPQFSSMQPLRLLFVGVASYTTRYASCFSHAKSEYWTLDILPEAAEFGSSKYHIVGNVVEVDQYFPPHSLDAVFLNGVLGFGVDLLEDQEKTLTAIWKVLKSNGTLLLGWNNDKTADPLKLDAVSMLFRLQPLGTLPARQAFEGSTHEYLLLVPNRS